MSQQVIGYAAQHSISELRPVSIERRALQANDVEIDVLFCGICHTDVHFARNDWGNTIYPLMPGHEIAGRVAKVGGQVQRFKVGDIVGVGCMVDSCHECPSCKEGLENYCSSEKGFMATYNGNQRAPSKDNNTYGGYSEKIIVRDDFVVPIPSSLKPEEAAPILCAGITTYSPLRHWKVGAGTKVGIVGFGGLGHMAVKQAKALGAHVAVITTSPDKKEDALSAGASSIIVSTDEKDMSAHAGSLELIVSTIPTAHDANMYMPLLKRDGTYVVVGCVAPLTKPLDLSAMIPDRKGLGTSLIGGIKETAEVLEFCGKHGIRPDIKIISVQEINDAYKKMNADDVDFRYVIDMSTLKGVKPDESIAAKLGL